MTPQRAAKRVQRAIRNIPVEQIAPLIAAEERAGMWCLVTQWDDPVQHALFVRYVLAHPERVHDTHEAAVAFVRSRLAGGT